MYNITLYYQSTQKTVRMDLDIPLTLPLRSLLPARWVLPCGGTSREARATPRTVAKRKQRIRFSDGDLIGAVRGMPFILCISMTCTLDLRHTRILVYLLTPPAGRSTK